MGRDMRHTAVRLEKWCLKNFKVFPNAAMNNKQPALSNPGRESGSYHAAYK